MQALQLKTEKISLFSFLLVYYTVEHLKIYGITAERHSIKRDIDNILILLNKEMDLDMDESGIEDRALLGYEVECDAVQHGLRFCGIAASG